MRSANAETSRDATTYPASCLVTSSAAPDLVVVMTGSPVAIASSAAFGNGS